MEKKHFNFLSFRQIFLLVGFACSCTMAQKQNTTPVPILKQINRHNEDGSYSYGYEAADGSYKIETKSATGEVKGKYGYVDDSGNLREIEYGANQDGFHPTGTGINVAPAAPHNPSSHSAYPALQDGEIDDGQYREDPNIYNDPKYNSRPSKAQTNFRINQNRPAAPAPRPQQSFYAQAPVPQQAPRAQQFPVATPRPYYNEPEPAPYQPQQNFNYQQPRQFQQPQQPYYQPQQSYQPQSNYQPNSYYRNSNFDANQPEFNIFHGHPAQNLNLQTGSYSLQYKK